MGEALAASRVFVSSRVAALEMYGNEGLKAISAGLPEEARVVADTALITEKWLPETWIMAWQEAVWHGPARADDAAFRAYIRRVVDAGFGRVRRLLVNLVTPATLCSRAAELWHDEHTHGEISAHPEGRVVTIRLRAHPYVARPVARMVMAESLRHAASLTRAKDVQEVHRLDGDALEVKLTWR
ncbi:MAG: hypothetical protein JWN44_1825 [Myxococcales bacterium]|nr:hypothetical protein [Myxococcales bacterium]